MNLENIRLVSRWLESATLSNSTQLPIAELAPGNRFQPRSAATNLDAANVVGASGCSDCEDEQQDGEGKRHQGYPPLYPRSVQARLCHIDLDAVDSSLPGMRPWPPLLRSRSER